MKKLAWPYNPRDIARQLRRGDVVDAGLAKDIARGDWLRREAPHAARMVPDALKVIRNVGDVVLAPATMASPAVLSDLKSIGTFFKNRPNYTTGALGALVGAPILMGAYNAAEKHTESDIMNLRRNPDREITASLDQFLATKAEAHEKTAGVWGDIGEHTVDSFSKGVGSGIGQGVVTQLFGGVSKGYGALRDYFLTDQKRKQLVESLIRTDPVISDAVSRNENGREVLNEAYGTMVRFAPSLSLDVNAVRSFLREAIIGGSGVNYATIKNLVETEEKASRIGAVRIGGSHA